MIISSAPRKQIKTIDKKCIYMHRGDTHVSALWISVKNQWNYFYLLDRDRTSGPAVITSYIDNLIAFSPENIDNYEEFRIFLKDTSIFTSAEKSLLMNYLDTLEYPKISKYVLSLSFKEKK